MKALAAFLTVGAGGALGSMARYGVGLLAIRHLGTRFPFGTMTVNLTGSLLIGFIAALIAQRTTAGAERIQLALSIGFLGGYTTFSTYSLESYRMLQNGQWMMAAVNTIGSAMLGLLAVGIGVMLARQLG